MEIAVAKAKKNRRSLQTVRRKNAEKYFVAWDGEGQNLDGIDKPQSYILLGVSTGERLKSDKHLNIVDICRFAIDVMAVNHPDAIHVGFAFNYDANMIIRSLPAQLIERLHRTGTVYVTDHEHKRRFCLRWIKGKWLSISEHFKDWNRKNTDRKKSITVKIYDIFSFFMSSFVKVVGEMLGESPELEKVREGKKHRGGTGNCPECGEGNRCLFDDPEYVESYWETEIKLLAEVAEELRRRFHKVGYRISHWYGPGALASFIMKQEGIKDHMSDGDTPVATIAQYAYAGGRFELFKVGRTVGKIYSYDINSAYPYAFTMLPSLSNGEWKHIDTPDMIAEFGVYRIRIDEGGMFEHAPSPFFLRNKKSEISYPWRVDGWYWSPEVAAAKAHGVRFEVLEGWEYTPATNYRPFHFINDMYAQRRDLKAAKDSAQMALKLGMNSMYGKTAQRAGYDPEKGNIPPYHQLEWAGFITSYTRAALWYQMAKVDPDKLIAVETDGFYTTATPEELGIENSKELGGWEIEEYDEIIYLQSGLAWLRQGDVWKDKRRGLDADTFTHEACVKYTKDLGPVVSRETAWQPYVGEQTRFITAGQALAYGVERMKEFHCRWIKSKKELRIGQEGKRVHIPFACPACKAGKNAYDMPHRLVISTNVMSMQRGIPHYIPWRAVDVGYAEDGTAEQLEEPAWMKQRDLDNEHRGIEIN